MNLDYEGFQNTKVKKDWILDGSLALQKVRYRYQVFCWMEKKWNIIRVVDEEYSSNIRYLLVELKHETFSKTVLE